MAMDGRHKWVAQKLAEAYDISVEASEASVLWVLLPNDGIF
jgi:hypothetical protein